MGTRVVAIPDERRESLRGPVLVSVILHAALFGIAVTYTMFGFHLGGAGREWGTKGAVRVGAISSMPGIPLPAPMLTTPSTVATQSPSPYKEEPKPKEETPPDAVEIPKFKDAVKSEKVDLVNKHIQKEEETTPPDNAIPAGPGGMPNMNYTQVVTGNGTEGVSMGEGNNFGQRYAWYVASMRQRISQSWLQSMISPNIMSAPRVYLTFEILRDGTVNNPEITQSSGIPEVDRSALRAILASNPLPPLPPDYAGQSVNVQFYFDFHRQ
jgi:protein TonB